MGESFVEERLYVKEGERFRLDLEVWVRDRKEEEEGREKT